MMRWRAGMSLRSCRPVAASRFVFSFRRCCARPDGRGFAADRADEGPGGCAADERRRRDVFEFDARMPAKRATRLRGLHNGEFRLLYVAPERLMLASFLEARCKRGTSP